MAPHKPLLVILYSPLEEWSDGTNWARMRARLRPNRTDAELVYFLRIATLNDAPLYQQLAPKVAQLRLLGMTYKGISESLNLSTFCVRKAHQYQQKNSNDAMAA